MFQRFPLALSACLIASASFAAVPELKPGNWEVKMTNETQGEKPSSFTMTQCMDKEQLTSQYAAAGADAGKDDFQTESTQEGCKFKSSQKGNTFTMSTECDGELTDTVGVYEADKFTVNSTTKSKAGSGKVIMEGKRLGDC